MGTRILSVEDDERIRTAVRLALERRQQAQAEPPPLAVCLPDHVKRRDVPVRPHRLDDYDSLMENTDEHA